MEPFTLPAAPQPDPAHQRAQQSINSKQFGRTATKSDATPFPIHRFRQLSLEQLGWELDRNRRALNTISDDIVVQNFAYPYGDLSIRTKRYLESRFESCRSGHAGINTGTADLGALDAWPLQNASIDGGKVVELIDATVQTCGWLIFYTHDVAESPSKYGVSPDLLEWAVGTATRSECVLTTVAESLILIRGRANSK